MLGKEMYFYCFGCQKLMGFIMIISIMWKRQFFKSKCCKICCQWQVKDFERNGLNLTSTMREEVQRLKSQIDKLSLQYVQNLNDDHSFLLLSGDDVVGVPAEVLEVMFTVFLSLNLYIIRSPPLCTDNRFTLMATSVMSNASTDFSV